MKLLGVVSGILGIALVMGAVILAMTPSRINTVTAWLPSLDDYELVVREDSAEGVLTLIRTDGRNLIVRRMTYTAGTEPDSLLRSLDVYLEMLISAQDSVRLHTRLLRDLYQRDHAQ